MPFAERFRAAWDCETCRFYRRAALGLAAILVLWFVVASL